MARVAWFTPLPPVRSGIAAYNVELLPLLAARHEIDVFTDAPGRTEDPVSSSSAPALAGVRIFSAHDFVWKHDRSPYDLIVYQLGNAACHDFMWPHLARFPGLVVLHDGQLHHERSRALLSRGRLDDYRAEFRYNHPEAPEHLPELMISALGGSLYYLYPMVRWVVRTARLVAVHSKGLASELTGSHHGVEVRTVRHGMIDPVTEESLRASRVIRARHGIPGDAPLFAAFGLVTPEKRISAALHAMARLVKQGSNAWLLLAGGTADYYDAAAEAAALGVSDRVRIAGYVADEELPAYVLAADVCLCLRWPTSRETSGTWIRAIACGKPTIVTDLAHNTEVPAIRSGGAGVLGLSEAPDSSRVEGSPVALAIDLLDEHESLYAAMYRLASDAGLRRELGTAARSYWERQHTMTAAVEDNLAVIDRALQRPVPNVRDLPAHLVSDHTGLASELLRQAGVELDLFPNR